MRTLGLARAKGAYKDADIEKLIVVSRYKAPYNCVGFDEIT